MERRHLRETRQEMWHPPLLEDWAADIAQIANAQIERINQLLDSGALTEPFELFLKGLQENIRPQITRDDAVEMLAQQMITRPRLQRPLQQLQIL